MVGHEVMQETEPEERNLGEYMPLMGNATGEHIIERRDAVDGHE